MPSLLDVLSGIGSALDTYSGAGSVRDLIAGENPWDQFIDPFNEEKRTSGRQMLEKRGWADKNIDQGWIPDLGDLGGFAAEMLLDPTNLLGGAGLAKRLMGISKAKTANRGIDAANALSHEQRAMGFMPEEVANLTKLRSLDGQSPMTLYQGEHPNIFYNKTSQQLDGELDDAYRQLSDAYESHSGDSMPNWKHNPSPNMLDEPVHLDVRKPLYRDEEYDLLKLPRQVLDAIGEANPRWAVESNPRSNIRKLVHDARFHEHNLSSTLPPNIMYPNGGVSDDYLDFYNKVANASKEAKRNATEAFLLRHSEDATEKIQHLRYGDNSLTGQELEDMIGHAALRDKGGYDSLVELSPSNDTLTIEALKLLPQYEAKIAPALIPRRHVHRTRPLAALLAGYNALAHTDLETDE